MSTETEVLTLTIEVKDAAVSANGLGVPLIAATHTYWTETVRTFEDLDELTASPLNVPTTSTLYKRARALKAQQPSPGQFKVGKRTGAIADDLVAIRAADDEWSELVLDTDVKADILAAAAWAETQPVLLFVQTADADVIATAEGSPTDVASALQTAGYHRTVPLYHHVPDQAAAAAWVGKVLPRPVGSATWANKSLAGVDVSPLTSDQRATLRDRNCNYYVAIKGIGFTLHGVAASGRFIDITQGMDWFNVRTQERVVALLANSDKVPYTDKGIELVRSQVEAQIVEAIEAGVADGDQPWAATAPLVAAVDSTDKIARTLPRVRFNFVLQGAIHKVAIAGTVLVAL